MSKRRTKKDKIIAHLRRQTHHPPSHSEPTLKPPFHTHVKRETLTSSPLPTPRLDLPESPQNSAISPHTAAVKQSLFKTLILAVSLAVFELVIYWAWR